MAKVKIQYVERKLTVFEEILMGLGVVVVFILSAGVIYGAGIFVYDTIDNNSKLEEVLKQLPRNNQSFIIETRPGVWNNSCTQDTSGNFTCSYK